MKLVPDDIMQYCLDNSSPESKLLTELTRQTHLTELLPQMLSGHIQGSFLSMVSWMIRPNRILEVGTFTGYSALCLAKGLSTDGLLYTIELEEEREAAARTYFDKSGYGEKIKLLMGKAEDLIPGLDEVFDLVFLDADKMAYTEYYKLVFPKVRKGGFILADNVLWGGKVIDGTDDTDTKGIREYNKLVNEDDRVENMLLPLRDGIMIARKTV